MDIREFGALTQKNEQNQSINSRFVAYFSFIMSNLFNYRLKIRITQIEAQSNNIKLEPILYAYFSFQS